MCEIEAHPFEPFIPPNSTVLIVGSFPGREQTNDKGGVDQWFYGAKRNQFWTILSEVYQTELKSTESKRQLFKIKGIAITDILLKIRRMENSNLDNKIEIVEYNDKAIKSILETSNFKTIFFTSKFVQKHFLKLFPKTVNGECLPSPSPRYARMSKTDKIIYYKNKLPK
jgi:hypoxanthine-DNA glycosylase